MDVETCNNYIYVIIINNNIYGCYDDKMIMDIQLKGLIQKKIITDIITIHIYNKNSFHLTLSYIYNNKINDVPNNEINDVTNNPINNNVKLKYNNDIIIDNLNKKDNDIKEINILLEEKQKLINIQNIINNEKKELKDKKDTYNNDIKLYNFFLNKINNDQHFILPEIFIKKFNIIKKLDNSDNLSFDAFYSLYYK